jgi:hypothetical protein
MVRNERVAARAVMRAKRGPASSLRPLPSRPKHRWRARRACRRYAEQERTCSRRRGGQPARRGITQRSAQWQLSRERHHCHDCAQHPRHHGPHAGSVTEHAAREPKKSVPLRASCRLSLCMHTSSDIRSSKLSALLVVFYAGCTADVYNQVIDACGNGVIDPQALIPETCDDGLNNGSLAIRARRPVKR